MSSAVVLLPLRVQSKSNARVHWRTRHATTRKERAAVAFVSGPIHQLMGDGRSFEITLTRFGRGRLDDDNLRDALKSVRDEVALQLGFRDDSDARLSWTYRQISPSPYSVRIEVLVCEAVDHG